MHPASLRILGGDVEADVHCRVDELETDVFEAQQVKTGVVPGQVAQLVFDGRVGHRQAAGTEHGDFHGDALHFLLGHRPEHAEGVAAVGQDIRPEFAVATLAEVDLCDAVAGGLGLLSEVAAGVEDDDPNELYAIPEIRKFYQHFHNVWPYWFYFCDLHTETLQMMTLCLLPNLQGFKRLGEPKAAVEYDPIDLLRFIERNFIPLNTMMERAEMSEMDIYNRTRDIFLYFNLPFNSEPPEE